MSKYRAAGPPVATHLPAWDGSQACAGAPIELFFPTTPGFAANAAIQQAKALCARCPLIEPCLEYALTAQGCSGVYVDGVWGGTTSLERRALRTGRGRVHHLVAAS